MTSRKATNPAKRIGVYKRLGDVPNEHRLERYADTYEDVDVWKEYLNTYLFERYSSERFQQDARLAGRRWRAHMADRGRHHALATPEDVEEWCDRLISTLTLKTAYNTYWVKLERFYTWLQYHTGHPHCYHPVLMAAAAYPAAGEIWNEKIQRGNE